MAMMNAVPLASLMPTLLPDGFQVGHDAKGVDYLSRDYDYHHNNATIYHSLRVTIYRYDSLSTARDQFTRIKTGPETPTPDIVHDDGDFVATTQYLGDPRDPVNQGTIERAYGVEGLYLVMVVEQSRGEPALTNVSAIAKSTLETANPPGLDSRPLTR